jgi:hypothetical protein
MVDPGIHAEMALLIQREQLLQRRQTKLVGDLELWQKRIGLAEQNGKLSLAAQAEERLTSLQDEQAEIASELESIATQKSHLRYESRRPSGDEVIRSETMVEMAKLSGLLPDEDGDDETLREEEAEEEEEDMVLDFSSE